MMSGCTWLRPSPWSRFKGLSREHADSDLRAFLTWCRQALATLHRELGLIRHPRDQRSRLLDERLYVFRFKRRVMGGRIGPDLADPYGLGFVGSADDVLDTARVALKQLGRLQQIGDQVIAPYRAEPGARRRVRTSSRHRSGSCRCLSERPGADRHMDTVTLAGLVRTLIWFSVFRDCARRVPRPASDLLKYVTETPCDQGIFFVSNRRKCVEMR